MGGERVVVKTRGDTVADMEVMDAGRGLKMACGENPKRCAITPLCVCACVCLCVLQTG